MGREGREGEEECHHVLGVKVVLSSKVSPPVPVTCLVVSSSPAAPTKHSSLPPAGSLAALGGPCAAGVGFTNEGQSIGVRRIADLDVITEPGLHNIGLGFRNGLWLQGSGNGSH